MLTESIKKGEWIKLKIQISINSTEWVRILESIKCQERINTGESINKHEWNYSKRKY